MSIQAQHDPLSFPLLPPLLSLLWGRLAIGLWLLLGATSACGDDDAERATAAGDGGITDAAARDGSTSDGGDEGDPCKPGEACLPTRTCRDHDQCERGSRCDRAVQLCVPCEPGSVGCACREGGCGPGLACQADLCTDLSLLPPSEPKCYTPCRADLVDSDDPRVCDADGLLEGCLDGRECVEGSCRYEDEPPVTCGSDGECPFFQACLEGHCYANCEADGDCAPGSGCHRRVCRRPCDGSQDGLACDTGFSCEAADGHSGFCVPLGEASTASRARPAAGLWTDESAISLSNLHTEGSLSILSDGEFPQDVVVRKLWHRVHYADGTGGDPVDAPADGQPCEGDGCPLPWLGLSGGGASTKDNTLTIEVPADCQAKGLCPELVVTDAGDVDAVRWEGALELCSQDACSDPVTLSYVQRPEGRWAGTLHYFGSFGGGKSLHAWRDDPEDDDKASQVGNALVRKWVEFRNGGLAGGWDEFLAILTATSEGSWAFKRVQDACGSPDRRACYLYAGSGRRTYSDDLRDHPVPTGEARFPVALHLAAAPGDDTRGMVGVIASETALQYPGSPNLSLGFVADPADRNACAEGVRDVCAVFMDRFASEVTVGGRYHVDGETCDDGYASRRVPWLVPGFEQDTALDPQTGHRYRYECRDTDIPKSTRVSGAAGLNANLSGANPVPDGRERKRSLRLLAGALIDQMQLFILFEESFDGFIPGDEPARAYGYMLLQRSPGNLEPKQLEGSAPPEIERAPRTTGVSCDQEILDRTRLAPAVPDLGSLDRDDLASVTRELMHGVDLEAGGWAAIDPDEMHWYCEETGLIDGGPNNDRVDRYADHDLDDDGHPRDGAVPLPGIVQPWACPSWSKVAYFAIPQGVRSQADIAALPCNQRPNPAEDLGEAQADTDSCHATIESWRRSGVIDAFEPPYACSGGETFCDPTDGLDYLANKTFYRQAEAELPDALPPLLTSLAQAFRYKIRFQSSAGDALGFAPEVCIPGSDQVPYCYEPPVIEQIRARLDCLIDIYSHHADRLGANAQSELNEFLRGSFSSFKQPGTQTELHEGFERLYAELLVMLGDEALTSAYASRFDLAGAGGAAFEGSLFEAGGIELTGVAGFEMVSLYRAVQYYQLALDRLYQMGPNYAVALGKPGSTDDATSFVSPETVTSYIERLVRAATQKARAQGEIAKHYQAFNRADLARGVLERAYTGTYLESVILSDLMLRIQQDSRDKNLDDIRAVIEEAQLRYRTALLEMRDIYEATTESVTYFGFAPDYIPLPALDSSDFRQSNPYESLSLTAHKKVDVAREREQAALRSNRSQRVEAAAFQGELVRVRNTYENQLAAICGTFEGFDGGVYPATRKYAELSAEATAYGDPCGRMGNGDLLSAFIGVEHAQTALLAAVRRYQDLLAAVATEHRRVSRQCGVVDRLIEIEVTAGEQKRQINTWIAATQVMMKAVQGIAAGINENRYAPKRDVGQRDDSDEGRAGVRPMRTNAAGQEYDIFRDSEMLPKIAIDGGEVKNVVGQQLLHVSLDLYMSEMQGDVVRRLAESASAKLAQQCERARVDSLAGIEGLLLGLGQASLSAQRANHGLRLSLSKVASLKNQADRLYSQQQQAQQLLLDVETARNDPNVRMYRNDAVINADRAFDDAMRAAYRATRVFEYYTGQSYAKREQLFLIRMASAGQYNLDNYMRELDNAFYAFEEAYGVPDRRVQILSLRDDLLRVPLMDEAGKPLTRAERIEMMRERLADPRMLDRNGYVKVSFDTTADTLSPLTRNHKIRAVEVDVVGSDVGDTLGRVYLRPAGAGALHTLEGDRQLLSLPARTAVIDAFFNGTRVFEPAVYQDVRLRDQPLLNTLYYLTINHRDEQVNLDIDLQSLTDIRLLIHYTDFTAP